MQYTFTKLYTATTLTLAWRLQFKYRFNEMRTLTILLEKEVRHLKKKEKIQPPLTLN